MIQYREPWGRAPNHGGGAQNHGGGAPKPFLDLVSMVPPHARHKTVLGMDTYLALKSFDD